MRLTISKIVKNQHFIVLDGRYDSLAIILEIEFYGEFDPGSE